MDFIIKVSKKAKPSEDNKYERYDDIYVQYVDNLDLQAVINAVNHQLPADELAND